MPIRSIHGNEEALDGMVHLESEAGLEDDGCCALSGVRDVLDEYQSKSGGPRAPDPDTLAKYARKLKTQSGLSDVDEVGVSLALFSVVKFLIHYIVIILLPRIIPAHLRALPAREKSKSENGVLSFTHLQLSKLSEAL